MKNATNETKQTKKSKSLLNANSLPEAQRSNDEKIWADNRSRENEKESSSKKNNEKWCNENTWSNITKNDNSKSDLKSVKIWLSSCLRDIELNV